MQDYDDPKTEELWCSERRVEVSEYLAREGVAHGSVGEWPAWHFAPFVSIWAVESKANPSWVGWWAICGDLPNDYLSAAQIKHPRDAMRAFADRWLTAGNLMASGQASPDVSVGSPADWPTLGPLLASRAKLLNEMAEDAELWDEA